MDKLEKVIKGLELCATFNACRASIDCPYKQEGSSFPVCYDRLAMDALEVLKEPRKTKDEILFAIVSAIGYESVDAFKETAEEVGSLDEFMIGMNRSIDAVKKLFAKDGEQE